MPRPVVTVPAKKGPELPRDWQATFLEAYRTRGGLWRAAKAAGVCHETVRRYRNADPVFDEQVKDAREEYADQLEERMIDSAERSDNPAGFIVRLKALRPQEYIEKHAVMNFTVTTELDSADGARVLQEMFTAMRPSTQALIGAPAPVPEATP